MLRSFMYGILWVVAAGWVSSSAFGAQSTEFSSTVWPVLRVLGPYGSSVGRDGGIILTTERDSFIASRTNFSPLDRADAVAPDSQLGTGVKTGRLSVTGNSGPYSIRVVENGLRLTSALRTNLTIKLHTISGRTIAVLFSGIVEPAISYDFSLSDKNLGSGVFYCTLETAVSKKTLRLVLTK